MQCGYYWVWLRNTPVLRLSGLCTFVLLSLGLQPSWGNFHPHTMFPIYLKPLAAPLLCGYVFVHNIETFVTSPLRCVTN